MDKDSHQLNDMKGSTTENLGQHIHKYNGCKKNIGRCVSVAALIQD